VSGAAARVRVGMVGGGPGAAVASVHRYAMRLDGCYDLVAGAFSRSFAQSRLTADKLGIDPARVYATTEEMVKAEAARPDGIELVSIVTPPDSHHAIAKAFLLQGIPVVCEKPLTDRGADAQELVDICEERDLFIAVTHNYSGYGIVRHAAHMVRAGEIGAVRMVNVEHASSWGASAVEKTGRKQAVWRTDPTIGGLGSVLFDLGTHAHHLLRFITGLEVAEVSAEMFTAVPGRQVFDSAYVHLRLSNGARGALWATMAATGHEHGLRIRIYGSEASVEWQHVEPQRLTVRRIGGGRETLAMGQAGLSQDAERVRRVGMGHTEGSIEAMANIYRDVAAAVRRGRARSSEGHQGRFPTARDGLCGVRFVEAVCASHACGGRWTEATGSTPSGPHGRRRGQEG